MRYPPRDRALSLLLLATLLGTLPGTLLVSGNLRAEVGRQRPYPYQSCFEIAASLHAVPLDVLLAVAATESNWNPDARSHANAHGIMQIQWPGTARHLGVDRVSELYNPCLNIELGARYLRELIDRNDGDLDRALAAYNYGPSRIEGLADLPAGAIRYVATVSGHRERIRRKAGAAPAAGSTAAADAGQRVAARGRPGEIAAGAAMRFDHSARARRFAGALNAQIRSAKFRWSEADGGYAVTMHVAPGGLSFADLTRLRDLGWPGLGGTP